MDLPPLARAVLSGPDFLVRGLAQVERDPQRRWILRRPRSIRRDFLDRVVAAQGDQDRWMLLQDDETRASYVIEVLELDAEPDRQTIWLLGQPLTVRESYIADVIDVR